MVSTVQPKHGSRLSHSMIPVALVSTAVLERVLGFSSVEVTESWLAYNSSRVICTGVNRIDDKIHIHMFIVTIPVRSP